MYVLDASFKRAHAVVQHAYALCAFDHQFNHVDALVVFRIVHVKHLTLNLLTLKHSLRYMVWVYSFHALVIRFVVVHRAF